MTLIMEFIERNREVTSHWHINQVQRWLEFDAGRQIGSVLVYAAYELRLAIERCLLELILFMKDLKLSEDDEKKCNTWTGLTSLMNETSASYKEYQKRVTFTNIVINVNRIPAPPVIPVNIGFLRNRWHRISNYCHMQLRPEKTIDNKKWVEVGFQEISKTLTEFERINKGSFGLGDQSSMPPEVRDLYQKFVEDIVDEKQVETRLVLMEPALSLRKWLKNR